MMLLARSSLRFRLRPPLVCSTVMAFSSSAAAAEAERAIRDGPRNDWNRPEIQAVYDSSLLDLLFHGAQVHRSVHKVREVQQCTLLSIKTGGCSEDCSYCPQSSRYSTGLKAERLMNKDAVLEAARKVRVGCGDGSAMWTGMKFRGRRCGQGGGDDIVRLKNIYTGDKEAGGAKA